MRHHQCEVNSGVLPEGVINALSFLEASSNILQSVCHTGRLPDDSLDSWKAGCHQAASFIEDFSQIENIFSHNVGLFNILCSAMLAG